MYYLQNVYLGLKISLGLSTPKIRPYPEIPDNCFVITSSKFYVFLLKYKMFLNSFVQTGNQLRERCHILSFPWSFSHIYLFLKKFCHLEIEYTFCIHLSLCKTPQGLILTGHCWQTNNHLRTQPVST